MDSASTKNANSLSDRVKAVLGAFNLSQNGLAKILGLSQSNVHAWINGGGMPQTTAMAFQAALGVRWQWLLHGEGEMMLSKIEHLSDEAKIITDLMSALTHDERMRLIGMAEAMIDRRSMKKETK